jgi:hypothetical protein
MVFFPGVDGAILFAAATGINGPDRRTLLHFAQ